MFIENNINEIQPLYAFISWSSTANVAYSNYENNQYNAHTNNNK